MLSAQRLLLSHSLVISGLACSVTASPLPCLPTLRRRPAPPHSQELARHLFPTHASTSTSSTSSSANSPAAAGSRALLRLQMAEYSERSSLSRLLGAPPGYVGFGQGGMLTSALRRRPATIVLCEDIDRAHPEVRWEGGREGGRGPYHKCVAFALQATGTGSGFNPFIDAAISCGAGGWTQVVQVLVRAVEEGQLLDSEGKVASFRNAGKRG